MPSEPLHIFDPRRNLQLQGFAGRAATTTIHDATETGVSVSGIFQAAEDFAVLGWWNAYDYYNHLRLKHLPKTDLSGLKLEFDIEYDQALDGATGTVSAAPAWDTLLAGDLPAHTHAESDVTSLATDLTNRPVKGTAWAISKAAVINSSGQLDGAAGTVTDCVLVNGSSADKANAAHTHAATDIVSGTLDNDRTSGTASATASTLVLRDGSGGASFGYVAANNQWAYLGSHFQSFECGAFQTVGGPFENMAKYSEDFTAATWDKNGGSCSATANSSTAPDGNATADTITAVTATPIVQQQIAGLASGGQYTFYVWAKVASGTKQVSIAIVDNAYAGYLAGPTSITLTTAWQRFKITGTLAGGQTGLWIVVRQFAGNAITGRVAPSAYGARACSRATIRRVGTPGLGPRRPRPSRPESPAARP